MAPAAMNPGRRALLAVLQRTAGVEVAARCGVAKSRVSSWASGASLPSPRARLALERNYGITRASWGSGRYWRT